MKPRRYKYSEVFRGLYTFLGYVYTSFANRIDVLHIGLKRTRQTATCPKCGRRCPLTNDYYPRIVRDLDIGNKQCYISFQENKINCLCGFRGNEKLEFVRPYSRCTIRFEEFIYRLCEKMTISDIGEIMGLDWKTIKDIDIYYTKQRIESLCNLNPTRLGIDEVAYEKGQKYLTVVRDLDLNKVIWVGLDRKEASLDAFFDELGWEKALRIRVAVLDMWDPFIASLKNHCPHLEIVFDKFHIVKYITDALDEVRRKEFAVADDEDRKEMKRKRFLILMRAENLDDAQREKLDRLMTLNETLYKGYLLKEQIQDILDEKDLSVGISRLERWIQNVQESGIGPFVKCIKTIKHYFYGICNFFKHQVTNAGSEGFNTKINIIRRRAYGYSDLDYFILKIFQACGVMK